MNEAAARRALVRYSKAMYDAGWVANHDGNLSVRIHEDRFVLTPTSFSKADVEVDELVVVDAQGRKTGGRNRPFSELVLHREVYSQREEVNAVVHAHPPYASAFGVSGQDIPHPFLPEAVVSLGAHIPTVPLTAPGTAAAEALRPFVKRCDAVLIVGNGVLTWGPTLELAFLRMELTEHLARIAHLARPLGGPARLPDQLVSELVAKRRKAGLSAPQEGAPVTHPTARDSSQAKTRDGIQAAAVQRALAGVPGADVELVARLAREIATEFEG